MTNGEIGSQTKTVSLKEGRDDKEVQLVTQISIGHSDEGFYLFFGKTNVPSGWDPSLQEREIIEVDIVAKIFLSPFTMFQLVNMLNTNQEVIQAVSHLQGKGGQND